MYKLNQVLKQRKTQQMLHASTIKTGNAITTSKHTNNFQPRLKLKIYIANITVYKVYSLQV